METNKFESRKYYQLVHGESLLPPKEKKQDFLGIAILLFCYGVICVGLGYWWGFTR